MGSVDAVNKIKGFGAESLLTEWLVDVQIMPLGLHSRICLADLLLRPQNERQRDVREYV